MRRSWLGVGGCAAALLATGCTATTPSADPPATAPLATGTGRAPAPTGFWSGTDSWPVPVSGAAPYRAPGIGGAYGGCIGTAGSWSYSPGRHGGVLPSSSAHHRQAHNT